MSGRVLQLALVTVVGVVGGVYTFGPILEGRAQEQEFKKHHDMGPGIVEVRPSPSMPPIEAGHGTPIPEKK